MTCRSSPLIHHFNQLLQSWSTNRTVCMNHRSPDCYISSGFNLQRSVAHPCASCVCHFKEKDGRVTSQSGGSCMRSSGKGPGNGSRNGSGEDLVNDLFLSLMWKHQDL